MLVIVIGVPLVSRAASQPASVRSYRIPGHGMLQLVVPDSWKDEFHQPRGLPPTVTFRPNRGDDFQVLITIVWYERSEQGFNESQTVRTFVEQSGQRALAQAVEDNLAIEELQGREGSGYYYSLTDRAPKPGEFKYMTQGAIGIGELMVTFTILYRSEQAPELQTALEMLRSATQKSE